MLSAPRHQCGGGIAVIYRPDIPLKQNKKVEKFKTFEVMEVTLSSGKDLWRFVNIYRAPYSKKHRFTILHFLEEFEQYLYILNGKNGSPVLVGDFNIHVENTGDINSKRFHDLLSEVDLIQQVPHVPTHEEGGTLDLAIARKETVLNVIDIIKLGTSSDHYYVSVDTQIVLQPLDCQSKNICYRKFKDMDVADFRNDLQDSGITDASNFTSLDEATVIFNNVLSTLMDKHCPIIKRKIRSKAKDQTGGWFDEDLRNLRRRRRAAERLKRKNGTTLNRQNYIKMRNSFNKLVWVKRRVFYQNSLEASKHDKRVLYKKINKLMGKEELELPVCKDELELAEQFMNFFTTKISTIRSGIQNDQKKLSADCPVFANSKHVTCKLEYFKSISESELLKLISDMPSKFCSLDPIPTWLLKLSLPELMPIIHYIVNQSLATGSFPYKLKLALVKPTLKSNDMDRDTLKSYRPVSNLAFLSKLLEKCALYQLTGYLEANNLMCEAQSGYRQHHSCETLLVRMCNDINTEINQDKAVALLLLDLSAAFDAIDHNILLAKLERDYGIGLDVLKWLKSYLQNRSFAVDINNKLSAKVPLLFGVPQGSLLGPVLFVLYTKELQKIAESIGLSIQLYADDSQLYIAFNVLNAADVSDKILCVEQCLVEVKLWMVQNFMKLNEDKTEFVLLGKKSVVRCCSDLTLSFSDYDIKQTTFEKDTAKSLGVKIDSDLSMKRQIGDVRRKAYWTLSNLGNFGYFLTEDLKISMVKTLILSKLDYCNALYAGINKSEVRKLSDTIDSAIRFIFNIKDWAVDLKEYYKKTHILPVELRIKYKVCLLVHKALEGSSPPYIRQLIFFYHEQPNKQSLRAFADKRLLLRLPTKETKISRRLFAYQAPLWWNALPTNIRHCRDTVTFKRDLKTLYFDMIDSYV